MGYWPDFNSESVFIFKNINFNMKNVTDFCKTVETGVDLHLGMHGQREICFSPKIIMGIFFEF